MLIFQTLKTSLKYPTSKTDKRVSQQHNCKIEAPQNPPAPLLQRDSRLKDIVATAAAAVARVVLELC
jgi:hypothetical protein